MFLDGAVVVCQAVLTSVGERCALRGELFFKRKFCNFVFTTAFTPKMRSNVKFIIRYVQHYLIWKYGETFTQKCIFVYHKNLKIHLCLEGSDFIFFSIFN